MHFPDTVRQVPGICCSTHREVAIDLETAAPVSTQIDFYVHVGSCEKKHDNGACVAEETSISLAIIAQFASQTFYRFALAEVTVQWLAYSR
jgi:hypothetical protein